MNPCLVDTLYCLQWDCVRIRRVEHHSVVMVAMNPQLLMPLDCPHQWLIRYMHMREAGNVGNPGSLQKYFQSLVG